MNFRNILSIGVIFLSLNGLSQQAFKDSSSRIGTACPDFLMTNILNYPSNSVKISDFKGKWLILNFWASWCNPCVLELPRIDSIQRKFGNKIQIIGVSNQGKKVVQKFLEQRKKALGTDLLFSTITGDTTLSDYFVHVYIPHTVWINPSGIIVAITSGQELTLLHAEHMIHNQQVDMAEKKDSLPDFNFQVNQPLFLKNNGGEPGNVLSYEILSKGFKPGLVASTRIIDSNHILVMNSLVQNLFQTAFGGDRNDLHFGLAAGFPHNRTLIKIKDSSSYTYTDEHLNSYCYDLFIPNLRADSEGINLLYFIMRKTLESALPFKAKIIKKKTLCLVLVRKNNFLLSKSDSKETVFDYDAFSINMKGVPFPDFVDQLRYVFLQMDSRPLIDETNLAGAFDIKLNANIEDPVSLAKSLQPLGLDLIEEYRDIEILVITDK